MFFDNDYEPQIIEDVSFDELEQRVGILIRPYPLDNLPNRWAWFSYLKAKEVGLNDMYSINFGYYTSTFIAGMGVDAGTDIYFKLEIDDVVFNIYEDCYKQNTKDEEAVKCFFNKLLVWYTEKDGASSYEKAVFHHTIRVTPNVKEYFTSQEGTIVDTLVDIIRHKKQAPPNRGDKCEMISFMFTYTLEDYWNSLPQQTDSGKLDGLINRK